MKKLILVKNGVVENIIKAKDGFGEKIAEKFDHVIEGNELNSKVQIGWAFDGTEFSAPKEDKAKKQEREARLQREAQREQNRVDLIEKLKSNRGKGQGLVNDLIDLILLERGE